MNTIKCIKLGTILTGVLALTAVSAKADPIIYNNNATPINTTLYSDPGFSTYGRVMADDFILVPDHNCITDVHWIGGYVFGNTPSTPDQFTIRIFSDSAGVPNNSLPPIDVAYINLARTVAGSLFSTTLYAYTADVVPAIKLPAGTPFWLSIVNDTTADTDDNWVWAGNSAGGNAVTQHSADDPTDTWHQGASRMDFQLTGPAVPEPSAGLLIVSSGVACLLKRRRPSFR